MSSPAAANAEPAAEAPEGAADSVFVGILHGLEAHRFVPGQRLVEVDLAAHFGVGRNSVREALQRLAAEGIAEIVRHKGALVRRLSLQETMDVLDVAERMTGLLARSAARSIAEGQPAQAVTRALALLGAADRAQDAEAFARARRGYYRALLETGGSQELRRLFPSIHMPIVHAQHRLPALQALRLRDYRAIGKAVAKGDAAAADKAGMAHVSNVRSEILRQVEADAGG